MISIITDSTCDIPEALIRQHGIIVVPQFIVWGDDLYRDRVDLQPVEFYERLATDPQRPTTSQANVNDFVKACETAILQGAKEIIILTVSGAMSGTYQMAQKAAKLIQIPVSVIDSKGPTMSLGWQVLKAVRARDLGADVKNILAQVDEVRSKLLQFVCMDTLEFLQRGGRLGSAVKWVGNLLQIKPLVSINHDSGQVEAVSISRTHKDVVEKMYRKFFEQLKDGQGLRIAVLHGNCPDEAEELAERIRKEFDPVELLVNITGPVLGINTGPRALALCGYCE